MAVSVQRSDAEHPCTSDTRCELCWCAMLVCCGVCGAVCVCVVCGVACGVVCGASAVWCTQMAQSLDTRGSFRSLPENIDQ